MNEHTPHDHVLPHDGGLAMHLSHLLGRRRLLGMLAGAGAVAVAATRVSPRIADAASCVTEIPGETGGPYPGDGTNGPNVLTQSGIVRSDIRSSFGSSSTTAVGRPLRIDLQLVDVTADCAPVAGAAVYLWHCNIDGKYSLYSPGVTGENYLRGVQVSDADGRLSFTSIFPAAYSGRWPHIHFEVYADLAAATTGSHAIKTSQLALPQDVCQTVYATSGYSQSVTNLAHTSLSTDMVFRDGWANELATVTGDVTSGLVASLVVGLSGGGVASVGDITVTPTTSPATVGATAAFVAAATPRRLLDTRDGAKPAAGSTTVMPVAGVGGVPPSGATAVVVNLTGTEATGAGFVTAWPDGTRPESSSLNLERTGQTRANLVTVPIGADGSIRVFTQSGTHLLADVFGWFVPAAAATAGRFQPLDPGRLLDTRPDSLVGYTGATPSAGSTVTVAVLDQHGVPASGVGAVVLNVTATEAAGEGFVTVWGPGDRPGTSNLNVEVAGQTIANQVVVPVSGDGTVRVFTQRGTHLVVDVTGWYTDSTAASSAAGLFIPVSPYRVADTRSGGTLRAGSTLTLLAAAAGTAAAGRSALTMNVTETEARGAGFVTVWPQGTRPTASSLNVTAAGQTISNHVVMPVGGDGGVRIFTQSGGHLVVDVTGWYV